jgi:DNA excision repair protein ERCC-3
MNNPNHIQTENGERPANTYHDFSKYALKEEHADRPIWIGGLNSNGNDNIILLEVNNPKYRDATNFLVSIAEPKSRPDFIHEY